MITKQPSRIVTLALAGVVGLVGGVLGAQLGGLLPHPGTDGRCMITCWPIPKCCPRRWSG
jgi:hypothetical protein